MLKILRDFFVRKFFVYLGFDFPFIAISCASKQYAMNTRVQHVDLFLGQSKNASRLRIRKYKTLVEEGIGLRMRTFDSHHPTIIVIPHY